MSFPSSVPTTFVFESCHYDPTTATAHLGYSFGDPTDTLWEIFDFSAITPLAQPDPLALQSALYALWLMAGVSYFKVFTPPTLTFRDPSLAPVPTVGQFFAATWRHGLGEFFYRNGYDHLPQITFPVGPHSPTPSASFEGQDALVPLGGGKDSLTTCAVLQHAGLPFHSWTVGKSHLLHPQVQSLGLSHHSVTRRLAPQIQSLNSHPKAQNGHVPITAILSCVAVLHCVLTGTQRIIYSNEASANEPQTTLGTTPVNHQYSKSFPFEQAFQHYVHQHVSPQLDYVSLLRPLTELRIMQVFAQHVLPRVRGQWSSCNRNFTLDGHPKTKLSWCTQCPKCAFVALMLGPWVSRDTLVETFGHDLITDPALTPLYEELLGLRDFKPWECVGEVDEVRHAAALMRDSGQWPELTQWVIPTPDSTPTGAAYPYAQWRPHALPADLATALSALAPDIPPS